MGQSLTTRLIFQAPLLRQELLEAPKAFNEVGQGPPVGLKSSSGGPQNVHPKLCNLAKWTEEFT